MQSCALSRLLSTLSQGNLLKDTENETGRREGISICLLLFSSQWHNFYKEAKLFEIAVFFIHNFFNKNRIWRPTLFKIVFVSSWNKEREKLLLKLLSIQLNKYQTDQIKPSNDKCLSVDFWFFTRFWLFLHFGNIKLFCTPKSQNKNNSVFLCHKSFQILVNF